ncbi:hypothetical protein ABT59_10355 [Enterococcus cecorum]|uniref:hypothetical protein n=1 Tax=Enterococcus cecorum TaxID=44008 RepID=UPI00064128F6|nr:hypothetical protein [Enterococcus cecorum]KLN91511.1 hypothetical protein ABT59_10355 [Enterococcus cecorum]KLN92440.1 hypothetical protein ABT60_08230 [Enterococcus cecorum]
MKMIDVLNMVAKGEIKDKTILDVYDHTGDIYTYTFDEKFKAFYDECDEEMANDFEISNKFLNYEVELIPPKPKKYLVKLNIRGLKGHFRYLNYYKKNDSIEINSKRCTDSAKTHFTKDELQSIQPVREFLEDMEGKYELIEVEE